MVGLGEAAAEAIERLALLELKQQRDQRHADRNAISGLLEVNGAAIRIERCVELVDAWQRMHDAGIGIFRFIQKLRVDPWICTLLLVQRSFWSA